MVLSGTGDSGDTCFRRSSAPAELAWFDVSWEAAEDLESLEATVRGTGVDVAARVLSVPPVDSGGRILFSGASGWPATALRDARGLSWAERSPVQELLPSAGDTGLLVFRLRFDEVVLAGDTDASLDEVEVTWTTADGETGSVVEPLDQGYSYQRSACS